MYFTQRHLETCAMTVAPLIIKQLSAVMADVDPIAKDKRNTQQNYSFRGIDDVYVAIQAILAKHQVVVIPTVLSERSEERTTKAGSTLIYRVLMIQYRFYAVDMSYIDAVVVGEGMDSGDKASNKAMSVAQKYAILQVFCIPTSEPKDPEHDSQDVAPKPPSGFDPTIKAHQDALVSQLKKKGITDDHWDEIAKRLKGKPNSELDAVLGTMRLA